MSEVQVVVLALSLAIGDFGIYYMILEKSFINRFRKFSDALNALLIASAEEFLDEFKKGLEEKSDPADLVEFTQEWAIYQTVTLDMLKSWSDISGHNRWIIIFCFLSILLTGFNFLNPNPFNPGAELELNLLSFASISLFLEILTFLSFIWQFSKLSAKISTYELGEPLESLLGEEVKRSMRVRNSEQFKDVKGYIEPSAIASPHTFSVEWHLSGAVMPVPPYGSRDIPNSDSASKLIVHQLEGEVNVKIICDMRGLRPKSRYRLAIINPTLNSTWPGRFSDTIPSISFVTDSEGCDTSEFNLRSNDFSIPGVHTLSVWLNQLDPNFTILISDNFEVSVSVRAGD